MVIVYVTGEFFVSYRSVVMEDPGVDGRIILQYVLGSCDRASWNVG